MKCPFCHKELVDSVKSSQPGTVYYHEACPTLVEYKAGGREFTCPHFERVTLNELLLVEEHWYLPPYHVVYTGKETLVGAIDEAYISTYTRKPIFKTIFTTPEKIHPDKPEKIVARLKILTLLS